MADKYDQLRAELIDEGLFLGQLDQDLSKAQHELLSFVQKHPEAAKGAKVKLTTEITLCCESDKGEVVSIKTQTKLAIPNRPAGITMSMSGEGFDDQPALFVRVSGSDKSHPKQGKLCTQDGRMIRQEKMEEYEEPIPPDEQVETEKV